jgi:hypothetical protein
MYINKSSYDFKTENGNGQCKMTFEIKTKSPDFISQEAISDPILDKMIVSYLTIISVILTNLLYFYKKSPLLSTFIAGTLGKELMGKNEQLKATMKGLP